MKGWISNISLKQIRKIVFLVPSTALCIDEKNETYILETENVLCFCL